MTIEVKVGSLVRIVRAPREWSRREELVDRQGFVRRIAVEGDAAEGLSSVFIVELVPDGEMVACADVALVDGDIIGTLGDIVRLVV